MSQPLYALSLFFHLVATAVWIGGLLLTVALVWPAVNRVLREQPSLYRLLNRWRDRFTPVSNLSLVVLIVTGLFQMTADPFYDGLMNFDNEWSRVMLLKHLTIVGMVLSGLLIQYGVAPALERNTLLLERGKGDAAQWARLHRREVWLTRANAALGLLVLGFSAWAGSL